MSRDSIEEQGGILLYGYCGNEPVNYIDALGKLGVKTYHIELAQLNSKESMDKKFSYKFRIQYTHKFNKGDNGYILAKLNWTVNYRTISKDEKTKKYSDKWHKSSWSYSEWFLLDKGIGDERSTPSHPARGGKRDDYDVQMLTLNGADIVCEGTVVVTAEYGVAKGMDSDSAPDQYFGIVPGSNTGSGDEYNTWKTGNRSYMRGAKDVSFLNDEKKGWTYTYTYRNQWNLNCCLTKGVDNVSFEENKIEEKK